MRPVNLSEFRRKKRTKARIAELKKSDPEWYARYVDAVSMWNIIMGMPASPQAKRYATDCMSSIHKLLREKGLYREVIDG